MQGRGLRRTAPRIRSLARVRPATGAIVVFVAAAAVLMLEIIALRLMAPYVGVSLNTYTGIIGTVLAGIAAGAWTGGRAADMVEPRKLLGPQLIIGGLLAMASAPLVRTLGDHVHSGSLHAIVALSATTVFLPAFVLSGVTPVVVKMQLHTLDATGRIVGRISAFGTAGALVGTFGTGFFLAARVPTRTIVFGIGLVLVGLGALLCWRLLRRVSPVAAAMVFVAAAAAGAGAMQVHGPCKVESGYFCIRVVSDGPTRVLMLDDVAHSLVDPRNPRFLAFGYAQVVAGVMDNVAAPGQPMNVLHIGGGAFTMPRYVAATRPGSTSKVIEIDPAVVDTARKDFGLRTGPRLRAVVGDARLVARKERPASYDLVIGDAFSGRSVPWHLTTREFLEEVEGLLRPHGAYAMNLIDGGLRFARAEAATMGLVFPDVAVLQVPGTHNVVLVGSNTRIDSAALATHTKRRGIATVPLTGLALQRFIGDAQSLRDDFAPVDQLLR
jgi:spermidine synthase